MSVHSDRVLIFFKNTEKARKSILGAGYNLLSRVVAGVVAGFILTSTIEKPTQLITLPDGTTIEYSVRTGNLSPEELSGIVGASVN